ncbi:Sensor protein KdpD [Neochlamydia sp. EPS4]|uniref:ATP-binding protein n=1 Tax=Neochlamydia sp. EPS4 TaxID=1478175 RepID=UPI0005839AF8|nr:ATP-binding protein [Neochlamydia sp. EPS4]KIC75546.1 Sensor protein KdpD [Neochlamydia sp. EPS4]
MVEEDRPDPEALLQLINREEEKSKGGKLKIFFGMAAGVGKTYAMLEDGQQRRLEGVDIVIGVINTHGRKETAALTDGLESIPEKSISYRGNIFTELDIDTIIKRKPHIVLIDELAHTNVPGSRHTKRWQDVIEILEAGIDVYTTLNVQHIESRKDVVEEITGIVIRETVPDSLIERASQIELVDITPTGLLRRLKEGKVYIGPQSEIAAKNFFQVDRLTALREIALRLTAEKVDHDLHGLLPSAERSSLWKPSERLMVAISSSPHSQRLIRLARRYAFTLDAPWIALHVDNGKKLSEKDQKQLAKNLSLARELGAEVITTADTSIGIALKRMAKQKNVTQIIIGRPQNTLFKKLMGMSNLLDILNQEASGIDVHVIHHDASVPLNASPWAKVEFTSTYKDYGWALFFTLLIAMLGGVCSLYLSYQMVGFIFFFFFLGFSLFLGKGPLVLSATIFSLIWSMLFLPSFNSPYFGEMEIGLFLSFAAATCVLSILTDRIKKREQLLRHREEKSQVLYEIVKELATTSFNKELFLSICARLNNLLDGRAEIFLKKVDDGLMIHVETDLLKDEKEKAVATWVFENTKMAGWSTDTLSSVNNLYLPLKGFKETVGILAFRPNFPKVIQQEEITLLQTICQQVAHYVERTFKEEKLRKNEYLKQIEKVQHNILSSLSLEFKTPLHSIRGAARELKSAELAKNAELRSHKIQQIEESSNYLNRMVENIVTMSQLSTGFLKVSKKLLSLSEVIEASVASLQKNLEKHIIKVEVDKDIPPIYYDFSLIELLLCNLLINAAAYSLPGKEILISSHKMENFVLLSVADEGPGIPLNFIPRLFEKFYRIPGTPSNGMGLGLAVVKTIADLHQAKIEVHNRPKRGTVFTLYFPLENQ